VAFTAFIADAAKGLTSIPIPAGGDRGGVADLIATIKSSKIPIICICNDKYSQVGSRNRLHDGSTHEPYNIPGTRVIYK
jgi:hypothetical protein